MIPPRLLVATAAMAVALAAAALFISGRSGPTLTEGPPPALSLLAVGDTGTPRRVIAALDPGLAVASAMSHEDVASPVHGIVLLGDNFYPDGLSESHFEDQLRDNLARPFCHFLRFTARGRGSLEEACPRPESERHPVPIHALLGNHDYSLPESPMLQRTRIPEYIENWAMPTEFFEVRELPGGVSLVLIDSMRWVRGAGGKELTQAVRRSLGPWRIIAAHHPMVDTGAHRVERFERRVGRLLRTAGVPIHLFVSGHEHNLQAVEQRGEWPPLHIVAGSGSDVREISSGDPGRRFARSVYGFARIDLAGDPERLIVTLFEVARKALPEARRRVVTRFAVGAEGRVQKLPLEDG
jgi:hypothetical protein